MSVCGSVCVVCVCLFGVLEQSSSSEEERVTDHKRLELGGNLPPRLAPFLQPTNLLSLPPGRKEWHQLEKLGATVCAGWMDAGCKAASELAKQPPPVRRWTLFCSLCAIVFVFFAPKAREIYPTIHLHLSFRSGLVCPLLSGRVCCCRETCTLCTKADQRKSIRLHPMKGRAFCLSAQSMAAPSTCPFTWPRRFIRKQKR